MLKKYRPCIITFYACAIISMIVATFYDLKIDIFLNNPKDPFSKWFEVMGEMPSRLIGIVAGVLIFYIAENKLLKIFGLVMNLGSAAYLGYHISRYLFIEENGFVFGILYGIGTGLVALWLGQYIRIPDEYKKTLLILSLAGIAVLFVQIGLIESIKSIWGRVRFRDLLNMPNYDRFTPWYHPNGINGNRSFPSGHTSSAALGYLAMLLPYTTKTYKKHYVLCFAVPFVHTAIVAYTRLVMGAHYLSDVTMGGVIGFTVVFVALIVIEKKKILEYKE